MRPILTTLTVVFFGAATALAVDFVTQPATVPATLPATASGAPLTPTTQPSPQILLLIQQIQQTDWHQRGKAEERLVLIGDEAIPALQEVVRTGTLDEARTAATRALKQIAENRMVGPSFITLHLKDVPAPKAFDELARQSFVTLKPFPDNLWAELGSTPKVSIDVDRQPFWIAMRQLARDTSVELGSINGEPRLISTEGQMTGSRFAVSGAFLVIASQIHRSQSVDLTLPEAKADDDFTIQFIVHAEPKLKVLSSPSVARLDQVVDDNGNSLLPSKQPVLEDDFMSPSFGSEAAYPLTAWLKYPEKNPGKKIATLKGSAQFTVQVESEKLDIPVKTVRGTTRRFKDITLTFGELQKVAENWQLKISAGVNEQHPAWEDLQNSIMGQLKVVDARGQPLDHHGFGSNGGGAGVEVTISFGTSHRPEDGRQSGEPMRVVWEIPTRTRTITVPFEFKDLKMP